MTLSPWRVSRVLRVSSTLRVFLEVSDMTSNDEDNADAV